MHSCRTARNSRGCVYNERETVTINMQDKLAIYRTFSDSWQALGIRYPGNAKLSLVNIRGD